MTLAEFLLARIAEDEAIARAADTYTDDDPWSWASVDYNASSNAEHGQRWQPVRVLADIEAKRRIVEVWRDWSVNIYDEYDVGAAQALEIAAQHLAGVYADHPDYQPEWKS